ncbi:MAG: DinB family protein [Thermoplasmata archaeon]
MAKLPKSVHEIELTRAWINWLVDTRQGYLDALLALPKKERLRDRGASFPSMQDIFLHILDNNVWWLESVPNDRQRSHKEVKGRLSAAEVRRQVRRIARFSRKLTRSLTPTGMNRSIVVRGESGDGKPFEMRVNLRTIIWHMVEEELQHRGEMNALFWQMNVDAPTRAWFSSSLAE